MAPSPIAALGFLAALTGSGGLVERQAAPACATGVHMIVARASTEPPGAGIIGAVARQVQQQIPGSDIATVDYPARLNPYEPSEAQGVVAMTQLVQEYAAACPDTKIVMMGYSQGAQVTADVLCGTSEAGFPPTEPQAAAVTDKVAAVVLMGDPSHVPGQPFNKGSSKRSGSFPRQNTAGCDAVASKMVSFCDSGDPFCDGGINVFTHLTYVQKFGDEATSFIVSKAGGAR